MGISWSRMRKVLEQDNICDSLKGRIQYFATRYRESHDEEGRVAVRLDGKEIFQSCFFDWQEKRDIVIKSNVVSKEEASSYWDYWDKVHLDTNNHGGFDQYAFYNAFHIYQNSSIDENLISPNPIVRLFAIMDRRAGKRRLQTLALEVENQPDWLQTFYRLRLEADGMQMAKKS